MAFPPHIPRFHSSCLASLSIFQASLPAYVPSPPLSILGIYLSLASVPLINLASFHSLVFSLSYPCPSSSHHVPPPSLICLLSLPLASLLVLLALNALHDHGTEDAPPQHN